MEFSIFVTNYWNKKRGKTGEVWTAEQVADWESVSLPEIQALFSFCSAHSGLTDAQLIALNPHETPFGWVPGNPVPADNVLDLTMDKITLRQLLAAEGK